ncbi:MAG: cysteine--tRNA ligase [Candidatus Vogelbacteria bacterium]|nr:cysteine--tRNA ligase [Candidatus Vogelbacteria bacterium]
MALKLYNTLTKTKTDFTPLQAGEVRLYSCGPTVYNYAHIGNFRAFIFSDTVRRTFEYLGYKVDQVMNITDVDDKTIRGAQAENSSLSDFTKKYEAIWREDLKKLNILEPTHTPHATDYIEQMITMIGNLLAKEIAYQTEDGIYFNITKAKNYGQLVDLKLDAHTQSRIQNDEYDKTNPQDFALWKFYKPEDGEVVWDAPFGKGRPGWHIECSAMSTSLLGNTIDIHTGGIDLMFPHHTNEIAQSEGATGEHFVNYWLHSGHINIADEKMSKSLGNIVNLKTLEEENISPLAFRYWVLTSHYRTTTNFTFEAVNGAQEAYKKLVRVMEELSNEPTGEIIATYHDKFTQSLEDDLNTAQTIALIWELLSDSTISNADKKATLLDFDQVLGLGLVDIKSERIPENILNLINDREVARQAQNWAESDRLRDEISSLGFELKDTPNGQKVFRK